MFMKHGMSDHPLYIKWCNIQKRCFDKKDRSYYGYGGRGITVCDEWKNSRVAFFQWALSNGWKPGLQIDRIDNDGNYEPSNCRFVTLQENLLNKGPYRKKSGLPPGVYHNDNNYGVKKRVDGKSKYLGTRSTIAAAVELYNSV